MNFRDIKSLPSANYTVGIPWDFLAEWLDKDRGMKVDMNPEYQRGYVWSQDQKTFYLEHILKGGLGGRDIFWNCPGWMTTFTGPMELVDGKQRISAVLEFMADRIPCFGTLYSEYEGFLPGSISFTFHIHNLENKQEIIEWYIAMNTGGSIHTEEDLAPAYALLKKGEI